jgi:hypothetical protein
MGIKGWMDQAENKRNSELADILGITNDELKQTEWELNDENPRYLLVSFSDKSPKEILAKIEGLEDDNTIRLDPNAFDNLKQSNEDNEQLFS